MRLLKGEEYALLQRFRDFAFINGGLPTDPRVLRRLAATYHVSSYKFAKIWPIIESFFEIFNDVFQFPADEEKRKSRLILIAKRQLSGMLGAAARWDNMCPQKRGIVKANQMANAWQTSPSEPQPEPHTKEEEPPPPPTPPSSLDETSTVGGGGVPPDKPITEPPQPLPDIGEQDFHAIVQRTLDLRMAAPSRPLAAKIRATFKNKNTSEMIELLVRWDGQDHAGLWGSKTLADFELEAARQRGQPQKMTAREESYDRLMRRAAERDRAAGRG